MLSVCWASAFLCTMIGTYEPVDAAAQRTWFAWGHLIGFAAVILTGWEIVSYYSQRERVRVEDLARVMADVASGGDDEPSGGRPVLTLHRG